jgi:hypothetical protein
MLLLIAPYMYIQTRCHDLKYQGNDGSSPFSKKPFICIYFVSSFFSPYLSATFPP